MATSSAKPVRNRRKYNLGKKGKQSRAEYSVPLVWGELSETEGSQDKASLGVYGKFKAALACLILDTLSQKKKIKIRKQRRKMIACSVVQWLSTCLVCNSYKAFLVLLFKEVMICMKTDIQVSFFTYN